MVEKSPNALSVFTRACRSRSSGTEKLAFSTPMPLRALADVDEPVLVAVDERPQQDAADDAEDGGVGADAERQRQDDGEGQALGPGQRPQSESEIGKEAHMLTMCACPSKCTVLRVGGMLASEGVSRLLYCRGKKRAHTASSNEEARDRHIQNPLLG